MSEKTETGTQTLDSSSETIELNLRQEMKIEPTLDGTSTDELTLRSVDERIKQATDTILRRVEDLCGFLASRSEMESAGNSEASGLRRNHESSTPHTTGATPWQLHRTHWWPCMVNMWPPVGKVIQSAINGHQWSTSGKLLATDEKQLATGGH